MLGAQKCALFYFTMLKCIHMDNRGKYYKDGYVLFNFEKSQSSDDLKKVLEDIYNGNIKEGFQLEMSKKFNSNASDFRPHPALYNPIFINILYEQDIFKKLKEATGLDLYLGNIKIRMNYSSKVGYSGWHRDTDFYGGRVKGNVPPQVNIHYYPCFDENPETTLKVWDGSHRKQTDYQIIDKLRVKLEKGTEVLTDNDQYSILDTVILHDVAPTTYKKGALRLMYNFCEKSQLPEFDSVDKKARELMQKGAPVSKEDLI